MAEYNFLSAGPGSAFEPLPASRDSLGGRRWLRRPLALDSPETDVMGGPMSTFRRILSRASLPLLATALPATSGDAQGLHELKLLAQDGAAQDSLGVSVSVDGGLALASAYKDGNKAGAAYLINAYTGQQLLKLTPQDPEAYDYFGR